MGTPTTNLHYNMKVAIVLLAAVAVAAGASVYPAKSYNHEYDYKPSYPVHKENYDYVRFVLKKSSLIESGALTDRRDERAGPGSVRLCLRRQRRLLVRRHGPQRAPQRRQHQGRVLCRPARRPSPDGDVLRGRLLRIRRRRL